MSAHTPGPWQVADDVVFQVRAKGDQMLVAEVCGWGHLTGRGAMGLSGAEAEAIQQANAHLIAAAPDLLGALEELVTRRERVVRKQGGSLDGSDGRYARARAALAKARGETP